MRSVLIPRYAEIVHLYTRAGPVVRWPVRRPKR
jgi:hypothetical protein